MPNIFADQSLASVVEDFPRVFERAVSDWEKFKLALEADAVPVNVRKRVLTWYNDFPKLWAGILPSFDRPNASDQERAFVQRVSRWIVRLRGEQLFADAGLGVAPIIIAGVLVAAAFGAAGLAWGVGYVKEQEALSKMIDQVAAGKVPADVLRKAVEKTDDGGFLAPVRDLGKYALLGALAVGAFMLYSSRKRA